MLKSFTDRFKNALGPKAEDIIAEDNKSTREERQGLREAEKTVTREGKNFHRNQRANDEVQKLRNKIEQTQAKIDAFDENMKVKVNCKDWNFSKILQYYFEQVKKELYDIQKQQQQKGKSQKEVDKLGESIASKEKERNTLEERLNSTKQRSRGREGNTLSESHARCIEQN